MALYYKGNNKAKRRQTAGDPDFKNLEQGPPNLLRWRSLAPRLLGDRLPHHPHCHLLPLPPPWL